MPRIEILEFRVSERAEAKFWTHGIERQQVISILRHRWIALRNRRHRAANHIVVGRDDSGRCIVVPVVPTEESTVWRPLTAWYCKPSEAAKLR
jgi:hypothetical protein